MHLSKLRTLSTGGGFSSASAIAEFARLAAATAVPLERSRESPRRFFGAPLSSPPAPRPSPRPTADSDGSRLIRDSRRSAPPGGAGDESAVASPTTERGVGATLGAREPAGSSLAFPS